MIPFKKPGQSESYSVMGATAAWLALEDAGLPCTTRSSRLWPGYVYGDSTCVPARRYHRSADAHSHRQRQQQLPTGSSALYLARQAVESGTADCALALGFEQMLPWRALGARDDREAPLDRFTTIAESLHSTQDAVDVPGAAR